MLRIFALYAITPPKLRPSLENPFITIPDDLPMKSSLPTSSTSTLTFRVPSKGVNPSLLWNWAMYPLWQM